MRKIISLFIISSIIINCIVIGSFSGEAKIRKGTYENDGLDFTYNTVTKVMHIYGPKKINKTIVDQPEENAKKIIIEKGVEYVDKSMFSWCTKLKEVKIPSSVKKISGWKYGTGSKIRKITVDKKNKKYSSKDGVLFNKKKTVLYIYPSYKSGKKYHIPNLVKKINTQAFHSNKYLKTIVFGKNVISTGSYSFELCKSLKTLTLNKKLKKIGDCSFSNCKKLKIVKGFSTCRINTISYGAFMGCNSFTAKRMYLPSTIKKIGAVAFYHCKKIKGIQLPAGIKTIGSTSIGFYNKIGTSISNGQLPVKLKGFKIYGKKNSNAYKYAKKNKIKFVAI